MVQPLKCRFSFSSKLIGRSRTVCQYAVQLVGLSVRHNLLFFCVCFCITAPTQMLDQSFLFYIIAPAHQHATRVAVYPGLFLSFQRIRVKLETASAASPPRVTLRRRFATKRRHIAALYCRVAALRRHISALCRLSSVVVYLRFMIFRARFHSTP